MDKFIVKQVDGKVVIEMDQGYAQEFLDELSDLVSLADGYHVTQDFIDEVKPKPEPIKIYNKLVRDKIPQIIKDDGFTPDYYVMEDFEYTVNLDIKLEEEVKEYLAAKTKEDKMEELADAMEVIYAILDIEKITREELEIVRATKNIIRGKFHDKVYLKSVW
jgi:predicted house-cleaning noncanonical NTP pyrophosphatase (MazG superfamily)